MKNLFNALMFFAVVGLLASCSQAPAGEEVKAEETKEVKAADAEAKTLTVDAAASSMTWEGSKVTGKHSGTVNIKSGSVQVKGTELTGGSFVIDMTSITVTDLKDKAKTDLETHLKKGDFFEADKFAEGKFEITGVKAEAGADGTTHVISGNLTLKDKSHGVSIPATVKMENGELTATTPQFTIDRQNWGINYAGKKDDLINDKMGIKLSIKAK
jgi:polyisoprenoid-binding protein YceI